MPRRKWNLNSVYISERLQEGLRPISYCALTTVIAPMGYGKTTAVNWFLSEREKEEKVNIVRISVYSGNVTIFWKSVQDAFMYAGYDFLCNYPYPGDPAGGSLLADMFCHELRGEKPCYVFIDDFHLMTEHRVSDFICYLVNRLPENVHLIIAGRDRFLPAAEILRLGNNVYQIGVENLRLNHTELSIYAHRCGFTITEEQIESLEIKCQNEEQYVNALSGGNKQKVAFGKWVGRDSRILILDCPTRGVDIGVKQAMYQLMYRMKQEGKSIILISEEMAELIGMSDRLLIMKDGQLAKQLHRSKDLGEADVIEYMI